jgi:hypothetical protein
MWRPLLVLLLRVMMFVPLLAMEAVVERDLRDQNG